MREFLKFVLLTSAPNAAAEGYYPVVRLVHVVVYAAPAFTHLQSRLKLLFEESVSSFLLFASRALLAARVRWLGRWLSTK